MSYTTSMSYVPTATVNSILILIGISRQSPAGAQSTALLLTLSNTTALPITKGHHATVSPLLFLR